MVWRTGIKARLSQAIMAWRPQSVAGCRAAPAALQWRHASPEAKTLMVLARPVELGLTEATIARWLYTSGTNMPRHT